MRPLPGKGVPAVAVLLAAVAAIYLQTLWFGFQVVWDDGDYVVNNPVIRTLSADNLLAMLRGTVANHWAPLPLLTFALEHAAWGAAPAGYHAVNVLLHAVNAVLVLALVREITGRPWVALAAALLFAVHPVNVENVAWVAERKSLLLAAFFQGSVLAWLRHRRTGDRRLYALALACAAGAALSKATVVSLPLVLAAAEALLMEPAPGPRLRRWLPLLPFAGLAVLPAVATLLGHVEHHWLLPEDMDSSLLLTTIYPTATTIWWIYARLLVWPEGLSALHDAEVYQGWTAAPVLAAVIAWMTVTAVVFRLRSRQARFWYLWFWACLLPVSNLIPLNAFYQERFLYLPAIGPFVLAFLALERARLPQPAVAAAVLLVAGALALAAEQRTAVWRDPVTLWEDAAAKSPRLFKTRYNLGTAYAEAGRLDEAEREFRAACALWATPQALASLRQVQMARLRATPTRGQ